MAGLSLRRMAQIAVGLMIVIVLRTLSELWRINACGGAPLASEGKLYLIGAMAAAAAAFGSFILFAADHHRLAIAVAAITTLGLFVFKVVGLA
jgi:hypothetical protein